MNAITTATPSPLNYGDLERLAASIAQSGLFGIRTKDQAISLMMIAHAEGRHPALAARDYDIIQGRPAKKAEAMMRDFIQAGGKVEWHTLSDEQADATFTHPQTGSVRIDWDMKRAAVAGLANKDNWRKTPRAMLRSRVVSEGVRTIWPLATSGMYVPDEVSDMPPHNGPTLEAKAEAPVTPPQTNPATTEADPHPKLSWSQLLDAIDLAFHDATSAEEIEHLLASPRVKQAQDHATGKSLERLDRIVADAMLRQAELSDKAEAFPETQAATP